MFGRTKLMVMFWFQLIQTISVMDKDDPPRGHKFFFEAVPEFPLNPNFTIVDNKGKRHLWNSKVSLIKGKNWNWTWSEVLHLLLSFQHLGSDLRTSSISGSFSRQGSWDSPRLCENTSQDYREKECGGGKERWMGERNEYNDFFSNILFFFPFQIIQQES